MIMALSFLCTVFGVQIILGGSLFLGVKDNSDKEISNAMLLELTKAIFSPQDTGFVKYQKDISSENRIIEISKSMFNTSKE